MSKRYFVGLFKDEEKLLDAVRELREKKYDIADVYSPYAIHGMDKAMGLKPSRLPLVTFFAGLTGLSLALFFQFYTSVISWRVNVGGKPDNSTLAFIPVTFEITVLLGALLTVLAFFIRRKLFPGARHLEIHHQVTNDTFALVLEHKDASFDECKLSEILYAAGAVQVENKVVSS